MFGETGKNMGENRRESWGKKKVFKVVTNLRSKKGNKKLKKGLEPQSLRELVEKEHVGER